MMNRKFLEDIRRLSKFLHTGRLEVYHSLLNKYCPKRQDFDKKQMTGRTQLAVLDHNKHTIVDTQALSSSLEESSSDAVTFINPDGVRVVYSKHCSDWVIKPISELKSYPYLKDMIMEVLKRHKNQEKGEVKAEAKARNIAKKPKPSKEILLKRHISRLSKC
ncbi:uncharacterized protein LOC124275119 [Haliotis rubra]|nr:uncharacterized protein LOC124275119 [Haliotis rubra]